MHIGQEDLEEFSKNKKDAISSIRQKIGSKMLGLSTHNLEEIKVANSLDLDYIGLGAYRVSSTKDVTSIGGEKLLSIAKSSKHKVALIGGVKLSDNFNSYPQIEYKVIGSDLIEQFIKK